MRKTFIIFVLTFFFSIPVFAQNKNAPCPVIKIAAPQSITQPGESMTFSVAVKNPIENSKLKYVWAISEGTIIEGQDTSMIKVVTTPDMSGANITAKVIVQGLPNNCVNEVSETSSVAVIVGGCPDEYGKIPVEEEFHRLDNVLIELENVPKSIAFFRLSIEKETIEETKKRIEKLMEHVKFRKFPKDRLIFAIEKSDYYSTSVYFILDGKEFPECNGCVIIKGEDIN